MQARKKVKISFFKKSLKMGSSLFEFIIYMAIGLLLLHMGSLWVQHAYVPFSRTTAKVTQLAAVASGLTVLKHDLYGAPGGKKSWKKIDTHELIWSSGVGQSSGPVTIGWRYQGMQPDNSAQNNTQAGELVRTEGHYDPVTQSWTQATKSVVAQQIEQFSFSVNYVQLGQASPTIASIKIEYVVAGTSYTQVFALRDRILPQEKVHE